MIKKCNRLVSIATLWILPFLLLVSFPIAAAITVEKTPHDVYRQVARLAADVRSLRVENNIKTPWPRVDVVTGYEPRHVYQKTLEILGKINSYRINIAKIGGITVPRPPGRDITPNEVYSVVTRLHKEMTLLVQTQGTQNSQVTQVSEGFTNKSPNDVYAALAEVSIALEETLGLRSIGPSEVYIRSIQVVELSRFLRNSQNLPKDSGEPARTQGRLPNHALQSVGKLLEKIQLAEHNLWMEPFQLPEIPRKVITPSDVFEAMGVAIAELHRIQFRLGLEWEVTDLAGRGIKGKTPDDVIQNAVWAEMLLPSFDLTRPLQQYRRSALRKTPNQVYAVTELILKRLTKYRRLRGVQVVPRKAFVIHGLEPQHVYGKALEVMRKVGKLRQIQGQRSIAVPNYPLRAITPSEVFDIIRRLDDELVLAFKQEIPVHELWGENLAEHEDKLPSDVFFNMQKISNLIDTLLGQGSYTIADIYHQTVLIRKDILLIAGRFGEAIPRSVWDHEDNELDGSSRDVSLLTEEMLALISKIKRRAGMPAVRDFDFQFDSMSNRTAVFNRVSLISTELIGLKVFLGISGDPEQLIEQKGITMNDVLFTLNGSAIGLETILHKRGDDE